MNYFKATKFLLLLPVLGICIVSSGTLFPFIVGKYVFFRLVVDIAIILFVLGLLFSDDDNVMWDRLKFIFKKPLVIAVSVFISAFLLACVFGINPAYSFWSNFERGEGGLQLLHFWAWFVLLVTLFREENDWHRLFKYALAGGVLMALYGIMAGIGVRGFIGDRFGGRLSGSIGNPAYTAAYAIFMLFYAVYLLVKKYRNKYFAPGALGLYALILLFSATFLLAATRGAFIGLISSIVVFLGFFAFTREKLRKWLIASIAIVIILVGVGVKFKDSNFIKSIPGSRIFDISTNTETFRHRTYIWKMAIDGFKERPVFGWGPENFLNVFDKHFNTNYFIPGQPIGAWFDRAHSIYFDYLAETGVIGLISFLGIFVVFFLEFLRNRAKKSNLASETNLSQALLFSVLVAYLVQGIVLFDVSPIYMNVFLILAFATYMFSDIFEKSVAQKQKLK